MLRRDWLLLTGLSLCIAAAFGGGAYMLSSNSPVLGAVVAVFAMAAGQLFGLGMSFRQKQELQNSHRNITSDLVGLVRGNSESKRQGDFALSQITELRGEVERQSDVMAAGFSEMKNSYASLAQELQTLAANTPRYDLPPAPEFVSRYQPGVVHQEMADPVVEETTTQSVDSPFGDQLLVSLEPIVDLHSGSTSHYRIHLGMLGREGEELSHEVLLHHADRTGVRSQLDVFIAREAESLLRRLRQRDPQLNIFMPIGAATLTSSHALNQIIVDRHAAADVASGLCFEIPHASLAGLTEQALEGLAVLARQNVVLSLTNVSLAGLDLPSMKTLNVRFVGLDVSAIDLATGPSQAMIGFAQAARASRVQMIVTGVSDPRLVVKLPQITRLAAGPCFAPPRRVKREMTQAATQLNVAA
jgi:EAL domain-containing protein (putative c-di-GMP-specific phosphodiesterase class I)